MANLRTNQHHGGDVRKMTLVSNRFTLAGVSVMAVTAVMLASDAILALSSWCDAFLGSVACLGILLVALSRRQGRWTHKTWLLAAWKLSSMLQRIPATRTSWARVAGLGVQQR